MVYTLVRKQFLEIGFTTTSLVYVVKSFFFFGDAHPDNSSPSNLFGHCLSCGVVQRKQDSDSRPAQDHSTRRDTLFSDYVHFTFGTRADYITREGKDVFIVYCLLSTAYGHPFSPHYSYSPPHK